MGAPHLAQNPELIVFGEPHEEQNRWGAAGGGGLCAGGGGPQAGAVIDAPIG